MENKTAKRVSFGAILVIVLLLVVVALAAMLFGGDAEEFLKERGEKVTEAMELQGEWLGMKLADLSARTALRFSGPPIDDGVRVIGFVEEGGGWRVRQSGLQPGDVITAVDGKDVQDLGDMVGVSRKVNTQAAIPVEVQRWGQPIALVIPPAFYSAPPGGVQPQAWQPQAWQPGANRPETQRMAMPPQGGMGGETEWMGLELAPITGPTAAQFGIQAGTPGMVVTETEAQAANVGLRPGDVVLSVNGMPINSMMDFNWATQNGTLAQGMVEIVRRGQRLAVNLSAMR